MAPWQAFVLGALISLVLLSIVYGSFLLEAEEKAYKKGLKDGEQRAKREM